MKLTDAQLLVIDEHIDDTLINKDKLIEYLEKHRTIKNDIFAKCAKRGKKFVLGDEDYCILLNSAEGFSPITREVFIRRIPILFHCPVIGSGNMHKSGLWHILPRDDKAVDPETLEALYRDLEFMYYDLHISLHDIFNYARDQVLRPRKNNGTSKGLLALFELDRDDEMFGAKGELTYRDIFDMWRHYLRLCSQLGRTEYMPERFLTAYNYALEEAGLNPVIYRPFVQYGVEYFFRSGTAYTCKGHFPCDKKGSPILRWTNIKIENAKSITFNGEKSCAGTLTIEISSTTTIHLLGDSRLDTETELDDEWYQVYAGPLNMEFDYNALKEYRKARGFTQKEVADAIGANARTYQKWENNESTPDGHYLLRIMNWLQIEDVQSLIKYREPLLADSNK